jgi:hypothetical protein
MLTYKDLEAATGISYTNLRQMAHIGKLPEPDGRIGISPYWLPSNPKMQAFLAEHADPNGMPVSA